MQEAEAWGEVSFVLLEPIDELFHFCVFLFTSCAVNTCVAEGQVSETTALQFTQNTNGQNATTRAFEKKEIQN